jgi:hypothetical protein
MSNIIKKTNRKNKTNLTVNWLDGFFTIEELHAVNSTFVEITLRSHVNAAKKENKIAEIGCKHNDKGRPKLVFAVVPVTNEVLEAARQAGVIFNENYDSIPVISVDAVKIAIDEEATSVDVMTDNINA